MNLILTGHCLFNESSQCLATQGYQQRGDYIATQGPLEQTTGDFWSMVVENQCSCIVMLCKLLEENEVTSSCIIMDVCL